MDHLTSLEISIWRLRFRIQSPYLQQSSKSARQRRRINHKDTKPNEHKEAGAQMVDPNKRKVDPRKPSERNVAGAQMADQKQLEER